MEDLLAPQEELDLNLRGSSAYFEAKIEDMHIKLIGCPAYLSLSLHPLFDRRKSSMQPRHDITANSRKITNLGIGDFPILTRPRFAIISS